MEVLGNNSHLKDPKAPSNDNIYGCHLPRDMNFGMSPSARSKGEADIGLLVACKVQLSSEVIKWKTENLRLVKELDSAAHHTDDLKVTVSKLVDRTKELEERLTRAEDENQRLKHRNVAMDEEKAAVVQRISLGFDKYHSFPSSDSSKSHRLSRESWKLHKSSDQPVEDYIQVSHSLLDKMKQEIQEFREMSCQYRIKDEGERPCAIDTVDLHREEPCDEELEEIVEDLLSETKSLKQYLYDQRRKLQSLLKYIDPDEHSEVNPSVNHEIIRSSSHVKISTFRPNDNGEYIAHSKSSGTTSNLNKLSQRKEVSNAAREATKVSQLPSSLSETQQQNVSHSNAIQCQENVTEVTNNPDHKICPICEESFNDKAQKEFEEHVLNHLERESASLLDQYVVI